MEIGGPRQRIVLAMMALNVNRVTPVERLIEAVWDDSPPSTARSQIQICISALRKLFSDAGKPGAITTRPPGYLLELETAELDSEQFGSLTQRAKEQTEEGRAAEAAASLVEALALWRGYALSGVPSDLVQRGAAILENNRMAALEERIRLDLSLARHEEISGELRAMCEEHPLREQLHSYLMIALYRSGRQAEALEEARRTRDMLVEEIGIEPGKELRNLELAILNRDPSLDLPGSPEPASWIAVPAPRSGASTDPLVSTKQPVSGRRLVSLAGSASDGLPAGAETPAPSDQADTPRQLPASIADFTGRGEQLEEIKHLLRASGNSYAMRIVAISGMGGVGKSSLAIRVAHELSDAFPDGHLYADLRADDDNVTANVLARFLRALKVNGSSLPDGNAERAELYRSRMAGKRMLIVLDDVASEEQVLPMLPGSPSCAVLITSRTRLSGLPGAYCVDVSVLDMYSSTELLANIIGLERVRADAAAAADLVNLCGGLPLALRIAGARLASRPHWQIANLVRRLADTARRLDEFAHRGLGLRSNIDLTYTALDKQSKRLFRLFALMDGGDVPGWTAAALLDTDVLDAEDVLEDLVDAQMIDCVRYGEGERVRYRFHDLIRVYASEQLVKTETEEERRAALSRVLGAWLALAEEAHRKEYGGDFTVLHGTAPRWRPSSSAHEKVENAIEWWETERLTLVTAVKKAAENGFDELCWDLALTLVSMFETRGYFDDWRETARLGLEITTRAGNQRGQAAMLYSLGSLGIVQHRRDEAKENLAKALSIFEECDDQHGRALVLRNLAYIDGRRGHSAEMMAKYAQSLSLLREIGDRLGEAHVLRAMAGFRIDEGDMDTARELLESALTACREVGSPRGEAQVLHRFAQLHMRTDELGLARRALDHALLIVRETGDQIGEAHVRYGLGTLAFREGSLDDSAATLQHSLELARRVGERLVEGDALYALGEISIARKDPATAVSHLGAALTIYSELGSSLHQATTLLLLSGLRSAEGDVERADQELKTAIKLLHGIDSCKSARLRTRLESARSALPG